MGKRLIIKGADFSSSGLPVTNVTSKAVMTRENTSFITGTTTLTNCFGYNSAWAGRNIWTLDISQYKGKMIRFTISDWLKAEHSSTGAVYYNCFASALNVTVPWTGTGNQQNAVTPVLLIDGKVDVQGGTSVYVERIPEDANYLVISNQTQRCPSPKFEILG